MYIDPPLEPPSPHPAPLGHHRAPALAPCVMWQLPTRHLFYTIVCVCLCYFLNFSCPLLPRLCPQVRSLCLCLHFLERGFRCLFSAVRLMNYLGGTYFLRTLIRISFGPRYCYNLILVIVSCFSSCLFNGHHCQYSKRCCLLHAYQ